MPRPMLTAPDPERPPSTTAAIAAFVRSVATALVAASIAAALVAGVVRMSFARDVAGRWTMDRWNNGARVHLSLEYSSEDGRHQFGRTLRASELRGLSLVSSNAPRDARFDLVRDAGTFHCTGTLRGAEGGGVFEFEASTGFGGELQRRGLKAPTPMQQFMLAASDAGLDLLDELARQKIAMPSTRQFVDMAIHGVSAEYTRGMAERGIRLNSVPDLVQLRDHGVDPEFVDELAAHGISGLDAGELVVLRDHGVDGAFVSGLARAGYPNLSPAELVTFRDHGVDPGYVRAMADAGYPRLSPALMIAARDHGLTAAYVRRAVAGLERKPSIERIIEQHDRGE